MTLDFEIDMNAGMTVLGKCDEVLS